MRALIRRTLLASLFLVIAVSCGDQVKHQNTFRGSWDLGSRKLPGGEVITPPAITGLLQWFPISEKQAHVIVTFTMSEDNIQVTESVYELGDQSFTRKDYVRIGGDYALEHQPSVETSHKTTQGRISHDGAEVTLAANGNKQVFKGAALTIMHENGTVDSWNRNRDQKGVLAK